MTLWRVLNCDEMTLGASPQETNEQYRARSSNFNESEQNQRWLRLGDAYEEDQIRVLHEELHIIA